MSAAPHPDPTLPPPAHEYTSAHVIAGDGPHAGLYAVELLGAHDCWQSGWAWPDPAMARRAANTLLARSIAGSVGA